MAQNSKKDFVIFKKTLAWPGLAWPGLSLRNGPPSYGAGLWTTLSCPTGSPTVRGRNQTLCSYGTDRRVLTERPLFIRSAPPSYGADLWTTLPCPTAEGPWRFREEEEKVRCSLRSLPASQRLSRDLIEH